MAVACHAVRRSGVRKRETAVIIGRGPIGLAVILMLKAQGVKHVLADGTVDLTPLINDTVGLDAVPEASEALGDPERHAKILIDPASPVEPV
jgi:threonine dehydrogenase-like Zn-dependent dehydrogenase